MQDILDKVMYAQYLKKTLMTDISLYTCTLNTPFNSPLTVPPKRGEGFF